MPNESNKCNGLVIAHAFGKIAMVLYVHEDGLECSRPGDISWPVGTLIESTFERIRIDEHRTLCEHTILHVHDLEEEPDEKPLTVADILQARSTTPDEPTPQDVIQRAKIPPKIRSNPSTVPVRTLDVPFENRYEYDLNEDELRELNSVRHVEPISTGQPVSPFSSGFNAGRTSQQPSEVRRKPGKPVSVFDLK